MRSRQRAITDVLAIAYVNGLIWRTENRRVRGGPRPEARAPTTVGLRGPGTDDAGRLAGVAATAFAERLEVITAANSILMRVPPINPSPLVDAGGNLFWISGSGQVVENGVVDTKTANVIEMAYVNGVIWREKTPRISGGRRPERSKDPAMAGRPDPARTTRMATTRLPVPIALT